MILPKNKSVAFKIETLNDYELATKIIFKNYNLYDIDFKRLEDLRTDKIWLYYHQMINYFDSHIGYDFLTKKIDEKYFYIVDIKKYLRINKLKRINEL